ncbi:MAG: hypothetical protein KJ600_01070 [Nanoarchaeota archaeon]|nr:hypothetical protein [Nanoarchaeota archaeon]MBU1103133.1 hypothetical protein [Nanoarchaeota archaeon]
MAIDVKKLIAAINPELYCDAKVKDKVKKLVKAEGYIKAAEKAELRESDYVDVFHVQATRGAFALAGLKAPIEQHALTYDAFAQNLEPIYFWILDYVNGAYGSSEKLVDNFVSSVGSGHFLEMQGKATRMQDEAMKIMQTANGVLRSVLNIIYDLKEFKMRLAIYDDYRSKEERKSRAALFSLKQIWMDNVDIKRGNSSIKGMAQQFDYVTLIDAFMAAKSLKELEKLDLNDRVKRILQQRLAEFERWLFESDKELRKRFEIEQTYLKSQVNSLKLYARWAKPYLKAARQLESKMDTDASVVTMFNTALFELVLLAKGKYDPAKDVAAGELPKNFKNPKLRKYAPIAVIEFKFRSVPDRADQKGGYTFRGKVDVKFTSFALNEDELRILKEQVEEDNFGDVYEMIEGATEKSLGELKADLDEFVGEGTVGEEPKEKKPGSEDVNPFSALFEFTKKEKKKDLSGGIKKDNDMEKVLRSQTILAARMGCRKLYDTYKKAHGMPAFPPTVNF